MTRAETGEARLGVVQVVYTVPVVVVVDLDERTVERVVVVDEEIDITQDVNLDDGVTPAPDDLRDLGRRIAEGDVGYRIWPSWEIGF